MRTIVRISAFHVGVLGLTLGCGGKLETDVSNTDGGAHRTDSSQPDSSRPDSSQPPNTGGRYFPAGAVWYQDISNANLDSESAQITRWLQDNGGWGQGRIQIDFSLDVLEATDGTPFRNFEATDDFFSPDCDRVPFPVPPGGNLEGEEGYQCDGDGDCHLIVVDRKSSKLYEMWRANITGDTFYGGCAVVWDMTRVYGPKGRGEQCTSADAAGYPIAPLLFTADEVAAGSIDHAIRFILPNSRIRRDAYVHPATHAAGSGPREAVPYGTRWRLRASYPVDSLPVGARVVARGLQRYGMLLADGGQIALTAQSDRHTRAKWEGLLGARDLAAIQPTDFEIVEAGERIPLTFDCVREP
ncbi:MAG: hypothetical protein HY698_17335 [Deltaproteobacteria bacterium]|nr:hypothetical protein [Deltaproteobacteria bacterium]